MNGVSCVRRRVLLIDDDRSIHEDFRKILMPARVDADVVSMEAAIFGDDAGSSAGVDELFDIDSVYQGRDGLTAVERSLAEGRPYALAFVDMRMPPGWDGLDTVEHLWDVDPWLQIVICSAYADQPWGHIIEKYGHSDRLLILRKPFDPLEVRQLALALTTKWIQARQAEAVSREQQSVRLGRVRRQQDAIVRLALDRSLHAGGFEMTAQAITELAADATEVDRVGIWMFDETRTHLRCADLYERSFRQHSCAQPFHAADYPAYFAALQLGRAIDAGDAVADPRTCELADYFRERNISSFLSGAIRIAGNVVGILTMACSGTPRAWQEDEVSFAGLLADQIALVLTETQREQAETALRESEVRLKTIVEAIQAGLFVIDAETHVIVDANPVALSMLGLEREQVVGKVCHKYVCPAEYGRCPVTDLGRTLDRAERTLINGRGEEISILKTVVQIVLHGRLHLLECFVDITDRKRAEAELAANRERLEELVAQRTDQLVEAERQVLQAEKLASVGRLAAGVAHEINTPIQYIGDNLHSLADTFQDLQRLIEQYRAIVEKTGEAQLHAQEIEQIRTTESEIDLEFILEDAPKAIAQGLDGVQRVASIVRAMKDFSHVKGGVVEVVDLNHALQSTLTVARNEYKYCADVQTEFGPLPSVECYPSELNQVFLNLLVNAAHAIQDKGGRGLITIATYVVDGEVEISIADSGVGIPEEIRDKIYDLFFTTKQVGRGTGQGLYLAHQIVVGKHGGTLSCESKVGEGTTFRIRIPIRLSVQPENGEPAAGGPQLEALVAERV